MEIFKFQAQRFFSKVSILALLCPLSANADQAVLIGGGYNLGASQGQIELNVQWVQDILQDSGMPVVTYFTDGDDPGLDVHYQATADSLDPQNQKMDALARVFGDHFLNQQQYKNHSISNVSGSTQADILKPALSNLLASAPDDPTLMVYNGHGAQSSSTLDQVSLKLWGDTSLTASELHEVLGKSKAPTRFVFTQCYSGGFHRIAYKNPEQGLALSDNLRCGFTAESAYRLSEGCSASVNTDDYRDYTTYFFAALSGFERNGEILGTDPDTNLDGQTSLREAHLYTLAEAHSTDMSRSTSENYLEQWEPWYLKWIAQGKSLPNNEYAKLFRDLANKNHMDIANGAAKRIRTKLKEHQEAAKQIAQNRSNQAQKIDLLQGTLINKIAGQWPAVLGPYTAAFESMAASGQLAQISAWVSNQEDYGELVQLQNQDAQQELELLELERHATQMEKLLFYRKLANLKQQLYDYGSASEINNYETLLACEDSPLESGWPTAAAHTAESTN